MTQSKKAVRVTEQRFVVDEIDRHFLEKIGVTFLGQVYMEYTSILIAAEAIADWMIEMNARLMCTELPAVVKISIERPAKLRNLPNPGDKTKARTQYFETTCETKVDIKPLKGSALSLYLKGDHEQAILQVFPIKKGA